MARIDAIIAFGFFGVIILGAILLGIVGFTRTSGEQEFLCYSVKDRSGEVFLSEEPVYGSDIGLIWKRDDAWGAVQSPDSFSVDRDCLRDKGVPVD